MQLQTAGLVVIKNRKLLLAFSKNKQAWYLPGGKTDLGETAQDALLREIKEELDIDAIEQFKMGEGEVIDLGTFLVEG